MLNSWSGWAMEINPVSSSLPGRKYIDHKAKVRIKRVIR